MATNENGVAARNSQANGYTINPNEGIFVNDSTGSRKTFRPANSHTASIPASVSTYGTDTTPVITETYIAQVDVPHACTVTGIAAFNGSVASGNIQLAIADDDGNILATTASTAMSGTDAYQRVPLTDTLNIVGGTYFILEQVNNTTARINTHTLGNSGASKKTGETYGTFTTITPPTTFTTAQGPVASLY